MGHKATTYVNTKYGTDISIKKIGLSFTGNIDAKQIAIKDTQKDTLIYANQVSSSIVNFVNLLDGELTFKNTSLDDVYLKIKTHKGASTNNFSSFINHFIPKEKKKNKPLVLNFDGTSITNGIFSYTNENLKTSPIVTIDYINFFAKNFKVDGSKITFDTNDFSFLYNNHINVENLATQFEFESGKIGLKQIVLSTNKKSSVRGDFEMTYNKGDMSDFYNKVKFNAQVNNSNLATTDLRLFYNELGKNQFINVNTKLKGTLNNFELKKINIKGLSNSVVKGNLRLKNSMSEAVIKDFSIQGNLKNLSTTKQDLSNLLPNVVGVHLPKSLEKLGKITSVGALSATPSSVDFEGTVKSQIGEAQADIFLDNLLSKKEVHYKGNINVLTIDLNAYTGNNKLGKAAFKIDVDGSGFLIDDLNTFLEGDIYNVTYNGYNYKNISVLGTLKYPVFDGKIISKDPNFDLNFDGLVNLNENENNYNFKAFVNHIDFKKLNFFKRDSIAVFKGNVIANLKGTNIDNTYGNIQFKNTTYTNQSETFVFKDFQLTSKFLNDKRHLIQVNSPEIIEGKFLGNFKIKNIKNLFQNSLASLYKNYEAVIETENEFLDFDLKIYNKIIGVFYPEINVGANTRFIGRVDNNGSKFNVSFNSPNISYKDNKFENISLKIDNSSKNNTSLSIGKLNTDTYKLSDFKLININKNDTLYSTSTFKGGEQLKDSFDIKLFHTINELNNSVIGIKKSTALLNGNQWFINQKNDRHHKIEFDNNFNDVYIDSIKINHNNERISFNGVLKDSTYKDVKLNFANVNLKNISKPIKNFDYSGIINGELNFIQRNKVYLPTSNLTISDFVINNFLLGDFKMKAIGNNDLSKYDILGYLTRGNQKPISLSGNINTNHKIPQLNFDIQVNDFDLKPFDPLGGIVLSNLRGKVNGKAKIIGNYDNPDFYGLLKLQNAGMLIQYLNVDLDFKENSQVILSKNEIRFRDAAFTDTKYKTQGVLSGAITHKQFKKWNLNLNIDSDRLLVLNTTEDDNELYYGTAYINGSATIKGPTDKLKILVAASSAEGTKFKIPISDTETIGDNSFIHFITPQEKRAITLGEKVYFEEVKGLELQFDLDLNKYAEVEVVIDKESGSTLKGYGAGTLLIEINTNGKFNMWGDFVAYQGTYDFRYGGILSKKFDVRTGNISWDGSPIAAKLDLSAVYKTNANPSILLENSIINRKIPVEVVTSLKGELLKPDLTFNIDFPGAGSIVTSELEYLLSDRTTRERQAFSLITQGKFYNDALIENSIITENLVERASDLVSSIFSDDDDKFSIGFNYDTVDRADLSNDQDSDEFGVSVSTQISNRILINGKVGIPVGGVTESVVVGDVRIDFLLNEDGTLRANIFNKENDIQFIGESNGYTQGVGLSYSYDFNSFKELIREIFTKKKKR